MLGSAILAAQALLLSGDNDACSRLLPGVASGESTLALCWAGAAGWSTFGVETTEDALTRHGVVRPRPDTSQTPCSFSTADGFYEVDPAAEGRLPPTRPHHGSDANAGGGHVLPVFVVGHWSGPKIWSIGSEPSF